MAGSSSTYFSFNVIDQMTGYPTRVAVRGTGFLYDGEGHIIGGAVSQLSVRTTHDDGSFEWKIYRNLTVPFADLAPLLWEGNWWNPSQPVSPVFAYPHNVPTTLINVPFHSEAPGSSVTEGSSQGDRIAALPWFGLPELIHGASGNDTLIGASADDSLFGGDGVDDLNGRAGNDLLFGDVGNDSLYGGLGDDALDGGASDDRLWGGDGHDVFRGQNGNDIIYGDAGNDSVDAGLGDDVVYGGAGEDWLIGFLGNDVLNGAAANDVLWGGDGNDQLRGGDGDDEMIADAGNDTLAGNEGNDHLDGGAGSDRLFGGGGTDTMSGSDGNDVLYGGAGNDLLIGSTDTDQLFGGDGADVFVFSRGEAGIRSGASVTVVRDFIPGVDRLMVVSGPDAHLQEAFDLFMATAKDSAGGVVWSGDSGASIRLQGVTLAELSVGDILPDGDATPYL